MTTDDANEPESRLESDAARALGEALDDPTTLHEDAAFLQAVRIAHDPSAIAEADHDAIVAKALLRHHARSRPNVIRVSFAVATSLAVAAAVFFVILPPGSSGSGGSSGVPSVPPAELLSVRSTQELFDGPFARTGGASSRIDRIAIARSADLRENRFRRWGVR
ncbi:MAG: hypothetical protein U0169_18290 [Polyangiaceae bacterium]